MYYKNKLLENINNGTDYKTRYGTVREVYLATIDEMNFTWGKKSDYYLNISPTSISNSNGQRCEYIRALNDYGFIVNRQYRRDFDSKAGYYEEYDSHVYAYIKM